VCLVFSVKMVGLRTKVIANCCNPVWNDKFTFNDISADKVTRSINENE